MWLELSAEKKHPDQFNLIPNELSDEFDGVPVVIANQGYSYNLWGDIKSDLNGRHYNFEALQGSGGKT